MNEADPQWFVQCTMCDDLTVQFYCNTCGDSLCPPCKLRHERSNASKHHIIVPYREKVAVKRKLCPEHEKRIYILYCQICNVPVCDVCTTSTHKSHAFSSIEETYDKRRQELEERLEYITSWKIPNTKDLLEKSEEATANYIKSMEKIETSMVHTATKIKEEVDHHFSINHKTLAGEKSYHLKNLKKKEQDIQCHLTELEDMSESYDACLKSKDRISLLIEVRNMQDKESPKLIDDIPLPEFIPGRVDKQSIIQQFGKLVTTFAPSEGKAKDKTKRKEVVSEKPSTAHLVVLRTLVVNPEIVRSFTVEVTGAKVACYEHLTWITGDKSIHIIENPSKPATGNFSTESVKTRTKVVTDMEVNYGGQLLISDSKNFIKRLSSNKTLETMFSTGQSMPFGIASLPNDNILVAMSCERKVVMFSSTGRIVQEFMRDILQHPTFVAYNKVTEDVCVSDAADPYSKGRVVVFRRNGKLRFTYEKSDPEYFVPQGIKTDSLGHILVADSGMGCIHILEKYGVLLQKVKVDKNIPAMPYSIDVDTCGCVWVSEYDAKTVHVIKYLESKPE